MTMTSWVMDDLYVARSGEAAAVGLTREDALEALAFLLETQRLADDE